jgi:hypothetical protein
MAIFSGKIVSSKFIDTPINTLIEVQYREGKAVTSYVLHVDFTSEDFNDLLQEVTLDEIEEETNKQLAVEKDAFYAIVEAEVDRKWAEESEKIKKAYDDVDEYSEEKQEAVREKLKSLQEGFTKGESKESKITGKKIVDLIQTVDDKDFIFDMKVAILEDPDITKSKDKAMKMSIRKAKTAMELLRIYTSQKV